MNFILINIIVLIGILVSGFELGALICMMIKNYNIHRYGCWWDKLPNWMEKVVDFFA